MNLSVQVKIFCFFKGDFIKNNFEIKISDKITFKEFIAQLRKNKKITPDFEKEINKNDKIFNYYLPYHHIISEIILWISPTYHVSISSRLLADNIDIILMNNK